MKYKYQVIAGCSVWSRNPTTFPKAKKLLAKVRTNTCLDPNDFEIERVLETGTGYRYWRKVLGKWVTYPQSRKRSKELTPYEHYTYNPRVVR